MMMETPRTSGASELDLPEGLMLEDEDDENDNLSNAPSQIDLGGSQESEVLDFSSSLQNALSYQEQFASVRREGDRGDSRKSSRAAGVLSRTKMLFEHDDEERPRSACRIPSDRAPSSDEDLMLGFQNSSLPREEYPLQTAAAATTKQIEVSEEIKGLFRFIDNYKPRDLEISTILKPFIPDFIPAVGGVDEFIKVPRPDGLPDYLGLKVLDERGPKQSDAAVVNLQLRASSMQSSLHPIQVASVENAEKNPKKLDAWIQSIKELHKTKAPPSVVYSKPMPSIEKLMQEWPVETEQVLSTIQLPTDKLELDIGTFADACCTILDIPVYKSRVESLHVMFSMYLELKASLSFSEEWPSRLRFPSP